jgi:hypothetical protein
VTAGHLALNETGNRCENRTRNPTTYRLADQGTEVSRTSGTRQHRNQCRKKLTASHTADRARYRVAERAKV